MSFLPDLRSIAYVLAALCIALLVGLWWGHHQYEAGEDQESLLKDKVVLQTTIQAGTLGSSIAADEQQKVVYVKGATLTITKKVPVYVTKTDDTKCVINNGFVSLWNDSNKMLPASAATVSSERPSAVVLSDVAAQHATEVGACSSTEIQRDSLKTYILGLQKLYSGK